MDCDHCTIDDCQINCPYDHMSKKPATNEQKGTGKMTIRTIDGKTVEEVFKMYRDQHIPRVVRDQKNFARWYDKAGKAVLDGEEKGHVIDRLAPWGCDQTQSNGVVAGANQARRLLRYLDEKK